MKLCAIYNCWDDWDLCKLSIENIRPVVDGIIIVASAQSNYGEFSAIPEWVHQEDYIFYYPGQLQPMTNEMMKRQVGLNHARARGYTHFITMDADEMYFRESVEFCKDFMNENHGASGVVVDCETFFGKPNLTIGKDITRVPFIHKLTKDIKHEFNRKYPYAWEGSQIRIDPTRSFNITSGVHYMPEISMMHYSWIRKDPHKKIRNSTARTNLERSNILNDLVNAKEGYFCQFYGKTLTRSSVDFGIPDYGAHVSEDLQPN